MTLQRTEEQSKSYRQGKQSIARNNNTRTGREEESESHLARCYGSRRERGRPRRQSMKNGGCSAVVG